MLVLDANILIRAVLGSHVLSLLRKYAGQVEFLAPDVAFAEAHEHLPVILAARKISTTPAMETLDLLLRLVQSPELETYELAAEGRGFCATQCSTSQYLSYPTFPLN